MREVRPLAASASSLFTRTTNIALTSKFSRVHSSAASLSCTASPFREDVQAANRWPGIAAMDLLPLMCLLVLLVALFRRKDDERLASRNCLHTSLARCGLCLLLSLFSTPVSVLAHPYLQLTIDGDLSESQRQNVRSFLSLARLADSEPLDETLFQRLYSKASQEAAKALEP